MTWSIIQCTSNPIVNSYFVENVQYYILTPAGIVTAYFVGVDPISSDKLFAVNRSDVDWVINYGYSALITPDGSFTRLYFKDLGTSYLIHDRNENVPLEELFPIEYPDAATSGTLNFVAETTSTATINFSVDTIESELVTATATVVGSRSVPIFPTISGRLDADYSSALSFSDADAADLADNNLELAEFQWVSVTPSPAPNATATEYEYVFTFKVNNLGAPSATSVNILIGFEVARADGSSITTIDDTLTINIT